jgi:hypothetical protein
MNFSNRTRDENTREKNIAKSFKTYWQQLFQTKNRPKAQPSDLVEQTFIHALFFSYLQQGNPLLFYTSDIFIPKKRKQ